MKAEVVFTGDFQADLVAQTRRLLAGERTDWAENLIEEIELLERLLAHSPAAGPVELRRDGREIRRLVLHKVPFVAWYHWKARARKVVVLRLFHVRQARLLVSGQRYGDPGRRRPRAPSTG